MSLEVRYTDTPQGAQENMSISGTAGNSISDIQKLSQTTKSTPWATLEPGVWVLDGTRQIMPDEPSVVWWSLERSGEDGKFISNPKFTFTFPLPYTATALTFTFSPSTEQWCSEINVAWYNGSDLITQGTYYPDSAFWVLSQTVESFDRVTLELIATNRPGQFAKLQKVEIGQTILFDRDELIEVQLLNEIDPTLCELTADTASIEIYDKHNRHLIPQENQRIEITHDGTLRAVLYVTSSTRKAGEQYSISAQSAIGLLEDTCLGGVYVNKPLSELLSEILGEWSFSVDSKFKSIKINGYLPICTQREALQQVAFAIGAVITTQGSSKIRFLKPATVTTSVIKDSEILQGSEVETSARIAKAEIQAHSYRKSSVSEELLQDEEINGTDVLVTFEEPHYDYTITGGTITGYGSNWVTITANGAVSVNGKKYTHNTSKRSKRNPKATAKEQGNIMSVTDATLVNHENVAGVLERLYSTTQLYQTMKQQVVVSSQKAGDIISTVSPWNSIMRGYISSMDSTLTPNGHTAEIVISGVEVEMLNASYYSGELRAGNTEVIY